MAFGCSNSAAPSDTSSGIQRATQRTNHQITIKIIQKIINHKKIILKTIINHKKQQIHKQ
ncbi:MAG: hypothetical protein ACLR6T_03945 [Intestinibacter sp.]